MALSSGSVRLARGEPRPYGTFQHRNRTSSTRARTRARHVLKEDRQGSRLCPSAALDETPVPGAGLQQEGRIRAVLSRLEVGSGAGGSMTLSCFKGSWMAAVWGRVMRTGATVSYDGHGLRV
jgi:hypothetical protein